VGSIRGVLPTAFISFQSTTTATGGFAAAIAIGAFLGQAITAFGPESDGRRRRYIAIGGCAGFAAMIGLFLFSAK
jgi:hypothetical protein